MNITTLGIDLAKNTFQLHGVDAKGQVVLKKKLSREALLPFIANLPACTIVVEACSGANYWCRQFEKVGHQTKMLAPQFVRPFVRYQKNDANDAQAIGEAARQPGMNFVPKKTIEQQDIQCLHRIRQRLVKQRTALINQIRGLLSEYGEVMPKAVRNLRKRLPEILENAENELTWMTREIIDDLYQELNELNKKIDAYERRLQMIYDKNRDCQRIRKIAGIGVLTATALIATIGDISVFKNGRHLAAYLGLVPRQHSSGNRQRLLGISKRGDVYLRTLLIHGARSALRVAGKKVDKRSQWCVQLKTRAGENKACVALANKNARTLWSILAGEKEYQAA